MAFNLDILDTIDDRVAKAVALFREVDMGTCVERTSDTSAMVLFDGSSLAVPVKLAGGVDVRAEDRVVMLRAGVDWVVVASFAYRAKPEFLVNGTQNRTRTNSVSLIKHVDLVVPLDPDNKYTVVGQIVYQSNNDTGDIKINFTGPSGASGVLSFMAPGIAAAGASNLGVYLGNLFEVGGLNFGALDGFPLIVPVTGMIKTGSTPGDLQFWFAQSVAAVGTTITILEESWLWVRQV